MLIRILMSWFPPTPGTASSRSSTCSPVTEPVLAPVRAMLPPVRLGASALDLSPIVLLVVVVLIRADPADDRAAAAAFSATVPVSRYSSPSWT